jgi:signal transduction histidine kinase
MGGRIPWQLAAGAALLVLLAVLGTLQYRWLNDVSGAERQRMRTALDARAAEFTDAVNREMTRLFVTFQRAAVSDPDAARAIGEALSRWAAEPGAPAVVSTVYVVDRTPGGLAIARYDRATRSLQPCSWPAALTPWKIDAERALAQMPAAERHLPVLLPDTIVASIPAITIPAPRVRRLVDGDRLAYVPDPESAPRSLIVALDPGALVRDVVAPLAARHFGDGAAREYVATIVRRDDPRAIVYTTPGEPPVSASDAERVSGLLGPSFDQLQTFTHDEAAGDGRFSITIVQRRRGPPVTDAGILVTGGAWQLRLRSVGGSLDAMVERSRRRNLAVGFGVLLLLAASFGLVVASASREQRLARQQIEFVAAVSHELRTPLAVICSAGENLADGVVADPDHVRRYGSLVRTEGRRLAGMVERVLLFAGVQAREAAIVGRPLDVVALTEEAIAAVQLEAGDRACDIRLSAPPELPSVSGEAEALRSAFHNVIGNAVKYSADGHPVDVVIEPAPGVLRVRVRDRGIGIDAGDLRHVFKPFFRGRRATTAQVRGSGIGLSIVRRVVAAHGGTVAIDSHPGQGTTVTIELPQRRSPGAAEPAAATRATADAG